MAREINSNSWVGPCAVYKYAVSKFKARKETEGLTRREIHEWHRNNPPVYVRDAEALWTDLHPTKELNSDGNRIDNIDMVATYSLPDWAMAKAFIANRGTRAGVRKLSNSWNYK